MKLISTPATVYIVMEHEYDSLSRAYLTDKDINPLNEDEEYDNMDEDEEDFDDAEFDDEDFDEDEFENTNDDEDGIFAPIYGDAIIGIVGSKPIKVFFDVRKASMLAIQKTKSNLPGLHLWKYREFTYKELNEINQILNSNYDKSNYKVIIPTDLTVEQINNLWHFADDIFFTVVESKIE